MTAPDPREAAQECPRCLYESKGLASSDRCICGPNVPCGWCGPDTTDPADGLSEDERETRLSPCSCGHTINDHGSMGTCWACGDEGRDDCEFHFEDLLVERIERIIAARLRSAQR